MTHDATSNGLDDPAATRRLRPCLCGLGALLAIIAELPVVPAVGIYVGFALLRLWFDARDAE